jgi:hypothetical protein
MSAAQCTFNELTHRLLLDFAADKAYAALEPQV